VLALRRTHRCLRLIRLLTLANRAQATISLMGTLGVSMAEKVLVCV
jgi:hypothetical protein